MHPPDHHSAAFFHGQVEQPVRGLMSLVQHKDIPVLIAINERGIFIIDHIECVSAGERRAESRCQGLQLISFLFLSFHRVDINSWFEI